MCGIVYYHNKNVHSVVKPLLKRFRAQRTRGTQGFGFVSLSLEDRKLTAYQRRADEKEITKELEELRDNKELKSNAILFHHRMPTSTPNLAECAHPFVVKHAELEDIYFVVHNGVISNDDDMKELHEALGYKYTTEVIKQESWTTSGDNPIRYTYEKETKFNDSEALAIDLARFIEGKVKEIKTKGTIAFIVLRASHDGTAKQLYYGRNYGNPLFLETHGDTFCLKSEGAFNDSVDANKMYCLDYLTGITTETECNFPNSYSYTGRGDYTNRTWNASTNKWEDNHRRDIEQIGLPAPVGFRTGAVDVEDEEPTGIIGAPSMTYEDYFNEPSLVDTKISELLEDHELSDLMTFALEEFYIVEELIEWESMIGDKDRIAKLEDRRTKLDYRIDLLEGMEIDQQTSTNYHE